MALTSASTVEDAENQLKDNLSWEGNPAKAVLFLEAARFLLVMRPEDNSHDGTRFKYSELEEQADKAQEYVANVGPNARRNRFTRGRGNLWG